MGGLHGALVLDRFLRSPEIEVVGIVQSTRLLRRGQGWIPGAAGFARRCGLRYAAYLWWSTAGAEMLLRSPEPIGKAARRHGIALLATDDLNDSTGRAFIAR